MIIPTITVLLFAIALALAILLALAYLKIADLKENARAALDALDRRDALVRKLRTRSESAIDLLADN